MGNSLIHPQQQRRQQHKIAHLYEAVVSGTSILYIVVFNFIVVYNTIIYIKNNPC